MNDVFIRKKDPFGVKYDKLENIDKIITYTFYASTLLSAAMLFVPANTEAWTTGAIHILFFVSSSIGVLFSTYSRYFGLPDAEGSRLKDYYANAFRICFGEGKTEYYYNNNFHSPYFKAASQTAENMYFTKNILEHLVSWKRILIPVYLILYISFILFRRTDISVSIFIIQLLISEPVLVSWIKMECLLKRSRELYSLMIELFRNEDGINFRCNSMYITTAYEAAKGDFRILFPSKTFHKLNPILSTQWMDICQKLEAQVRIADVSDE